ncbi:FAS-associated factor 1 [Strongyloides ratti]|uniref:FAS-associated factor 1 n=1 Tax=Strongyloides ratti TaxID=34506 RepID=A0A090LIE3_STRRB|nr:FAS-associated factor 1 [Strongyloides ratti]CEF67240.1 FAS-associated factor 1 [Strongyloides ratti]
MDELPISLSTHQRQLIERYKEIMNLVSTEEAFDVMVASDWNLENAVSKNFDFIGGDRRLTRDTGESSLSALISNDSSVNNESLPKNHTSSNNLRRQNEDEEIIIDDDEIDDDDYIYSSDDDCMIIDDDRDLGANGVPLIPEDFTSVEEALHNLSTVFEARYGITPPFTQWSLSDVIQESLNVPYPNIQDRKPVLIYIFHDKSVSNNIFPLRIFFNETIKEIITNRYVSWAWDVTSTVNRKALNDMFKKLNIQSDNLLKLTEGNLPKVFLLIKERAILSVYDSFSIEDSDDSIINKLLLTCEKYNTIKDRDIKEHVARKDRENTINEQSKGYEESLARDRARKLEQERLAELQRLEEENRRLEEIKKSEMIASSALKVPDEPGSDEKDTVTVKIRFPDSKQSMRRFYKNNKIGDLVNFIVSLGYPTAEYAIYKFDRPKRKVSDKDLNLTFEDASWPVREQVFVEEI